MDVREELHAISVAIRRYQEEILAEIRKLRQELEEERRRRRTERWLLAVILVLALVGWVRP
jgi:predicted nucleic acid-binding Zn ribbon protein